LVCDLGDERDSEFGNLGNFGDLGNQCDLGDEHGWHYPVFGDLGNRFRQHFQRDLGNQRQLQREHGGEFLEKRFEEGQRDARSRGLRRLLECRGHTAVPETKAL
jgi:hypothetical protein